MSRKTYQIALLKHPIREYNINMGAIMFDFLKKKEAEEKIKAKYRFLVVDDDADIREIYREELAERYEAEVNSCAGTRVALKYLKTLKILPDVIICDINIPNEKSGLHLSRELKKMNIDIPVIYVSGLEGGEVHDDKYTILNKPLDMKKLDRCIKSVLHN